MRSKVFWRDLFIMRAEKVCGEDVLICSELTVIERSNGTLR